ncbi:Acetyl esterase/lipase [Methylobacterium sp. ap11]|uniref:alpha/beta hydrolase n=1 Tax=Methylobacterium sp. ap11 TaxID=1761799 RepID=UPI0008AAE88B|nr:alpha/beta hydrolase [Methylobacterium sp. ap11]SEO68374.1 Acetyl esterase/lipase [Methylobacterium sp. ap11]
MIDHALFDPAKTDPDAERLNREIIAAQAQAPDPWSMPVAEVRERRRRGSIAYPAMPRSARAETITIAGPGGPLALRVIRPQRKARGAYLHIHSGGWVWGGADEQDPWLERIAERCGFVCVSVEYRLAPEHPYPAPIDDCEAAALWLYREGRALFGVEALTIGGESVGAHLSVMTLLRLRDRHRLPKAFRGANLFSGLYDLGVTASARNWGDERLVLNSTDIRRFADGFVPEGVARRSPDVSPLYADLAGLPPALFSVGTRDPLLDDTLFMSMRWASANNGGYTSVYTGGCHVFIRYNLAMTQRALELIERFLMALA